MPGSHAGSPPSEAGERSERRPEAGVRARLVGPGSPGPSDRPAWNRLPQRYRPPAFDPGLPGDIGPRPSPQRRRTAHGPRWWPSWLSAASATSCCKRLPSYTTMKATETLPLKGSKRVQTHVLVTLSDVPQRDVEHIWRSTICLELNPCSDERLHDVPSVSPAP